MDATPEMIARLLYERETFFIVLCIFTGFILWDALICLPEEIKYIFYPEAKDLCQGKTKKVALPSLLLLLARLLVIPMVATQLTTAHGQSKDCRGVYRTLLNLYAIIVANGTAVFIVRTVAIRRSKWPLQTALWTIWLAFVIFVFYASWKDASLTQLPREPFTATCLTRDLKSWTWVVYLCGALFDVMILILTLQTQFQDWNDVKHPLMVWKRTRSDVSQLFYRDALAYFVLSVTVNFAIVGWFVVNLHNEFFTILIAPIHIWMNLTIPPRVIRSLKLLNAKANFTSLDYSINAAHRETQSNPNKILVSSDINSKGIPFERSKTFKVSDVDEYTPKTTPRDERFAALHSSPVPELHKLDEHTVVPFLSSGGGKEY